MSFSIVSFDLNSFTATLLFSNEKDTIFIDNQISFIEKQTFAIVNRFSPIVNQFLFTVKHIFALITGFIQLRSWIRVLRKRIPPLRTRIPYFDKEYFSNEKQEGLIVKKGSRNDLSEYFSVPVSEK